MLEVSQIALSKNFRRAALGSALTYLAEVYASKPSSPNSATSPSGLQLVKARANVHPLLADANWNVDPMGVFGTLGHCHHSARSSHRSQRDVFLPARQASRNRGSDENLGTGGSFTSVTC